MKSSKEEVGREMGGAAMLGARGGVVGRGLRGGGRKNLLSAPESLNCSEVERRKLDMQPRGLYDSQDKYIL